MARIKTLIHVHTNYSFDSDISLKNLRDFARREAIGCIAVTDHDTIEGARRLAAVADFQVIVGEEVTTCDGHLIGLFLQRRVEPGMSARDTALAIKEQGGIVLLPHPFVTMFGCGLNEVSWQIADLVDAVEVNNAQNLLSGPDRRAEAYAAQLGLPAYVGTDTHLAMSIAPCWQTMPAFDGPASFLSSLRQADLTPGRHPLSYFAVSAWRTAKYFARLSLGANCGVNAEVADPRAVLRKPALATATAGR